MATELTALVGALACQLQITASKDATLAIPNDPLNYLYELDIAFGTGDNQADQLYYDSNDVTETDLEYDFYGGVENNFGDTVTFSSIKGVIIRNSGLDAIEVSPGDTDPAQLWFGSLLESQKIEPGGIMIQTAPEDGWTVDSSETSLIISAWNVMSGRDPLTAATYDIIVWGVNE